MEYRSPGWVKDRAYPASTREAGDRLRSPDHEVALGTSLRYPQIRQVIYNPVYPPNWGICQRADISLAKTRPHRPELLDYCRFCQLYGRDFEIYKYTGVQCDKEIQNVFILIFYVFILVFSLDSLIAITERTERYISRTGNNEPA
jgi:hypothetical protein